LAVRDLLANLLEHYIQRWLRHALRAARPSVFLPSHESRSLKAILSPCIPCFASVMELALSSQEYQMIWLWSWILLPAVF